MKRLSTNMIILSTLALPVQSLSAAEADGERGTASVYDEHPKCMERTDGAAANPNCTRSDGPPRRKVIGARTATDTTKGSDQGTAQTSSNKAGGQASGSAGAQDSAGGVDRHGVNRAAQ